MMTDALLLLSLFSSLPRVLPSDWSPRDPRDPLVLTAIHSPVDPGVPGEVTRQPPVMLVVDGPDLCP